jgi:hypothetical protein
MMNTPEDVDQIIAGKGLFVMFVVYYVVCLF